MISHEDREHTATVQFVVFRCDSGCCKEIAFPDQGCSYHPAQQQEFKDAGWVEVVSDFASRGPIFCGWHCLAEYASKAALKVAITA